MTKAQKITVLSNIDRRGFLVGAAATGLVFGYVALPEVKSALVSLHNDYDSLILERRVSAWQG